MWLNSVTFVGVLNACASVIVLEEGRFVWRVFLKMPSRDLVTCNAILGGFAMHGHGKEVLKHFAQMCEENVQPDDITFICLLSAYSRAGLVDEGMRCYASMVADYMTLAKLEHYTCMTCMVDLLGCLAVYRRQRIWSWQCPVQHMWMHGWLCFVLAEFMVMEIAERVAKQILEMEPENAVSYVLLSSIYASAGKVHLCENVEWQIKEKGAQK